MKKFSDFHLSKDIEKAIHNLGFEEATPIQAEAIPIAMTGKDLIGQAQTGTGKTTAFGIPLIERVELGEKTIQGIVLAPTRELAIQVAEELNRIGQVKGVQTLPIYGGQDINRQIKALKKRPHIISATPGRLMDHMKRRTIRLDHIRTAVLDEADEMLNMGFIEDIQTILGSISSPHQTLLFSATMPKQIQSLAQKFMNNPEIVKVKAKGLTVKNIEQQYVEIPENRKFDVLCNFLDLQSPDLAIVFGRTKRRVDELAEGLRKRGYAAEGIHGDLTQSKRADVIRQFKEHTIEIMVATDVAARGLDITGVSHVYNFDIPQDPESYVHRIGRTGRAGTKGLAVTFITTRERHHLKVIEDVTKTSMSRQSPPTSSEVIAGNQKAIIDRVLTTIDKRELGAYTPIAEKLLEEVDSVTLLSATLKLLTKESNTTPVQLTDVAPLRNRKAKTDRKRSRGRKEATGRKKTYRR
ncbi:DEAD/DEAH box helicase [Priestia filamentosa]|uniref:DEAD/DEAH box helicase n=1 Tax=Priestia filamentosa TaxID=1402861 RepID=UPI0039825FC7